MKHILAVLIVLMSVIACDMPDITMGSMSLSINSADSRTLIPDIVMDAHSFQISGAGPAGSSFYLETSESQNLVQDLAVGDWTITIDAMNIDGLLIGRSSSDVTVIGGQTIAVKMTVTPLEGNGDLDLTVFWDTADVANPNVNATLLPSAGPGISLVFTESVPGTSNSATTLSTGYYTLILQLLDTDTVVMGAVETVRIVADQTTSGIFDFTEVNGVGTIDIEIDVDLDNPIEVALAGTLDTMVVGDSMTVTASAPLETEIITYSWYVNGSPAGNGETLAFGSTLNPGVYRLDVIALSSDGSRSGSTNHAFTVTSE